MPIVMHCIDCGRQLRAPDKFAGKRAVCPGCGTTVEVPSESMAEVQDASVAAAAAIGQPKPHRSAGAPQFLNIEEFLDPPGPRVVDARQSDPQEKTVVRRMLEALLDPRAIQWLLLTGGGLAVLGLIVWLVSKGLLKDPRAVAVVMGLGSLVMLAAGWAVTLKTRYRTAGQAVTFLACVVAPLNLWFYHTQGLVTLDNHLWVGGLFCVLLYAATVFVLRDALFMYAVEAGVTLTILLLMADLGLVSDAAHLSLWLLGLAFVSIHSERALPVDGDFPRRRFGLPLFWSGQVQLCVSLLILLSSQAVSWLSNALQLAWPGNLLTENDLLAGGLWLAAVYLYLYSYLVVHRVGAYVHIAGMCLLMAEMSLLLPRLHQEGLIASLALTAVALHFVNRRLSTKNQKVRRQISVIAGVLSALPLLLGVLLHMRATSTLSHAFHSPYTTGWLFVGVMLLTAVTNRVSAWLLRDIHPGLSALHFFWSAAALLVAAAGLLRQLGCTDWSQQAPLVMLIPIAYIVASRVSRGRSAETPLARVSHASTAVILASTFVAALKQGESTLFEPLVSNTQNLLLALTFCEAALFYTLAGMFRRRTWNAYFAAAAGCGALWQFLGYFGVATVWHELLFALLGVVLLIAGRMLGLREEKRYGEDGLPTLALHGAGLTAFQSGSAVLSLALLVTFLKGMSELAVDTAGWLDVLALLLTCGASAAAMSIVPTSGLRRWYATMIVFLAGVMFLQLNVLVHLSIWRKAEIFCVASGLALLMASHVALFREEENQPDDSVTLGLWGGSFLAAFPLFVAMFQQRFLGGGSSLFDEIVLLTVTILMLTSGCGWRIRATTLVGGGHLFVFLLIVIGSLVYQPQVALGVYLLIGGGAIFAVGVLLGIYRDRLLALPEQIAKREGLFRIITWR